MKNIEISSELLVSVLIPLIITSSISIITLIVNSIIQLIIEKNKLKLLRYNEIIAYYPKLKSIIVSVISIYNHLEKNCFYSKKKFNLFKYNGKTYEQLQCMFSVETSEISEFNDFYNNITELIKKLNSFWEYMNNKNIPLYNRVLTKRKNKIQYTCFYLINSIEDDNSKKHNKYINKKSFYKLEKN